MASAKIFNMDGAETGTRDLSDAVFDYEPKEVLVKDVVLALQSATHQGTHKTKRRDEVSGGGAKPFRQKGTGRARQGSSREPHMRGGGTVFGPVPRSYRHNIPARSKRQALCSVLSDRVRKERLSVLSGLVLEQPKTGPFARMVNTICPERRKTLVITAEKDEKVLLSARNMPTVTVRTAADVNVLDVISAQRVVVQEEAIAKLEERLS